MPSRRNVQLTNVTVITPEVHTLVEALFEELSERLPKVLSRRFGLQNRADIEDIVQDTFLAAMVCWTARGVPSFGAAWLTQAAKYKAADLLRRRTRERKRFVPLESLSKQPSYEFAIEQIRFPDEIEDPMLRAMAFCAHPALSVSVQITFALKTLWKLRVRAIAAAFDRKESGIEKRLARARMFFRSLPGALEVPQGKELIQRRSALLQALYFLFLEGGKRTDRELSLEAMRLTALLAKHKATRSVGALMLLALMVVSMRHEDWNGRCAPLVSQMRYNYGKDSNDPCSHRAGIKGRSRSNPE